MHLSVSLIFTAVVFGSIIFTQIKSVKIKYLIPKVLNKNRFPFVLPWTMVKRLVIEEISDPYNVNGLEFKCVILFGVDEGRLPQNTGVSDISANYIKYIAFNQLYLASSRAKYRLILIGNSLHGVSSCLQYALESGKLETGDQV